jgi:retron-type reverse transcriptase
MKKVVYFWGVLFGGNANNSANAGFVYANTNNTPSNTNTNVSSQLCLEIYKSKDLGSCQKINNVNRVLVRFLKIPFNPAKMKRIGNLYDRICSVENLQLADEKARKGKLRSHGVIKHDRNREQNLIALHEQLKAGVFKTSKYDVFTIHEPKEREIYRLPYFPDRIVHHAVMNVLEPVWVSIFTADTYSCIKDRGIHAAARKVKTTLQKNPEATKYCLKIDIRKFYLSINHDILKQILRRKIKDIRLLALLDEIVDSVSAGVPIGNYLSQYFANLYLAYFDHWLKEKKGVKYYFRYADDIVILHHDKQYLHDLFKNMQTYLAENLKLKIKDNWQVFPVAARGIDFVGYVFYHTHTRLRKSIKQRFCRRLARINKRRKPLSKEEFKQSICPWWGWVKYCNSINLIKKLSKISKYEIVFKY